MLEPLYNKDIPAIFTSAAGVSNAEFEQFTDMSRHVYDQILRIFAHFGLDYYLFAGSVVGYVRNGRMPAWVDDLDIIVFDDQVPLFEDVIAPYLIACGFRCTRPRLGPEGGRHVLSMMKSMSRDDPIALTRSIGVTVPWSQVDVFYTTVDRDGFIRNPAGWGLYHKKNVPVDFVKPGRIVAMDGWYVKIFDKYREDIALEYGDVENNLIVRSHKKVFLKLTDTPWHRVAAEFQARNIDTVAWLPPAISMAEWQAFRPVAKQTYIADPADSLEDLIAGILREKAAGLRLAHEDQIFWAMDIHRLFPGVSVTAAVTSRLGMHHALHLRRFINVIDSVNPELIRPGRKTLRRLRKVFGRDSRTVIKGADA